MRSMADSIRRTMKLAQRRKVPFGREENVAEMLALRNRFEHPAARLSSDRIELTRGLNRAPGKKAGCRRFVGTPRVNQRLRDVPGWNLKVGRLWRVQHFAAAASAANWTALQQRNIATDTASPCGQAYFGTQYLDRGISITRAANWAGGPYSRSPGEPNTPGRGGGQAPQQGKETGAAPTAPQGQSQANAGRLAARERHAYSLALNSTRNLRGSVIEAV